MAFKPLAGNPNSFFYCYWNDLWFMPCALPMILFVQRKIGSRSGDAYPSCWEVTMNLVVWSIVVEVVGPVFLRRGTCDWRDVVMYGIGGLCGWVYWNRKAEVRSD